MDQSTKQNQAHNLKEKEGIKVLTKQTDFGPPAQRRKTVAEGNRQITSTCSIARRSMDMGQAGSQLASAGTREEMRRIPADGRDRMKKKRSLGAVFSQIQIDHQIDVSRRIYNRLQSTQQSSIFLHE